MQSGLTCYLPSMMKQKFLVLSTCKLCGFQITPLHSCHTISCWGWPHVRLLQAHLQVICCKKLKPVDILGHPKSLGVFPKCWKNCGWIMDQLRITFLIMQKRQRIAQYVVTTQPLCSILNFYPNNFGISYSLIGTPFIMLFPWTIKPQIRLLMLACWPINPVPSWYHSIDVALEMGLLFQPCNQRGIVTPLQRSWFTEL